MPLDEALAVLADEAMPPDVKRAKTGAISGYFCLAI